MSNNMTLGEYVRSIKPGDLDKEGNIIKPDSVTFASSSQEIGHYQVRGISKNPKNQIINIEIQSTGGIVSWIDLQRHQNDEAYSRNSSYFISAFDSLSNFTRRCRDRISIF